MPGSLEVVVSLVYWALRRLLELLVLRTRSEREKEIEILVLRQQLRVLERQVARPRPEPADRVLLACGVSKLGLRREKSRFAGGTRVLKPYALNAPGRLQRRDLLGGLIHEYQAAA